MSRILIIGVDKPGHVGRFLKESAQSLRHEARIVDTSLAMGSNRYLQSIAWRLDHYPIQMGSFERLVQSEIEDFRPDAIISTGLSPLTKALINRTTKDRVPVINYSTDDPWNPAHRSRWFMKALPCYTKIYTTRKSVIEDLKKAGAREVEWLPFAIDPINHYPEPADEGSSARDSVTLIGGADKDRLALLKPIIKAELALDLWGGYWQKYTLTKPYWRGMATSEDVRKILSNTCCALTLVRRANRDGHAMRTFEVAAMGAPALAERTDEHVEILGEEGSTALYFEDSDELVSKARWMIANPKESKEMGSRLHNKLALGGNTYADRLTTMLQSL